MNDEYILNYLNKNYALNGNQYQTNMFDGEMNDISVFNLVDIHSGQVYQYDKLKKVIFTIFSDDYNYNEWFDALSKRGKEIKKTYLDNISYDKSCDELILDATIYFEEQKILGDKWIKILITESYLKKVIEPKIKDFITPLSTRFQSKTIVKKAMAHFMASEGGLHEKYITKTVLDLYKPHIETKIAKHLDNMDIDAGSIVLFGKLTRSFKNENCIFDEKIRKRFKEYYDSKIEKIVYEYIESLDKTKITTCNQIKVDYPRYNIELVEYCQLVIDKINKWYNENILDAKIDDFLSQLIVRLGERDWNVYWIGHGLLNEAKMLAHFKEENFQESYIQIRYDNWHEEAVLVACEKELRFN